MRLTCSDYKTADMQVLMHHIYEYKKGLRSLVLHTMSTDELFKAEELLLRKGIRFFVQFVNERKINIFFGMEQCVSIIESFNRKSLTEFTEEEDFILGIMLGYDRTQQYDRYVKRKGIVVTEGSANEMSIAV